MALPLPWNSYRSLEREMTVADTMWGEPASPARTTFMYWVTDSAQEEDGWVP